MDIVTSAIDSPGLDDLEAGDGVVIIEDWIYRRRHHDREIVARRARLTVGSRLKRQEPRRQKGRQVS